jgi:hypothetical protein
VDAAVLHPRKNGQASGVPGSADHRCWMCEDIHYPRPTGQPHPNCLRAAVPLPPRTFRSRKDFLKPIPPGDTVRASGADIKHEARIPCGDPGFSVFCCQGQMAYAMCCPSRMLLVPRSHEYPRTGWLLCVLSNEDRFSNPDIPSGRQWLWPFAIAGHDGRPAMAGIRFVAIERMRFVFMMFSGCGKRLSLLRSAIVLPEISPARRHALSHLWSFCRFADSNRVIEWGGV